MKPCIVIPTFNESKAIAKLVSEIRNLNLPVLVIDDGSSDNTAEIAQKDGAEVVRNDHNLGKGASLAKGFRLALEKGYDAVITMDGDGQHLPQDLPLFLSAATFQGNDIVIGNRMVENKTMPLLRVKTNEFMSWLISMLTKQDIPDTQCGFRLIKKEVLEKLDLRTSNYDTESEILIKAARLGFKIISVPIKTVYQGEKSKINPFTDTIRFFNLIIRELWITKK